MISLMSSNVNKYYFADVPRLGNVAVSRHAQEKMKADNISFKSFKEVLFNGDILEEGFDTTWVTLKNIRLVIIRPTPFKGALLVKTLYYIKPQEKIV